MKNYWHVDNKAFDVDIELYTHRRVTKQFIDFNVTHEE
jgi:hypothetical protein